MYLLVSIFTAAFMIEFRIFWAFAKPFTDERFIQFLLYLPIFLPFFLVNGGVFLFGELRQKESTSSFKTHFYWWLRILFTMLFGLLIVFLVQYLGVLFGNYPYYGIPTDWMWWMRGSFNPIMPIQLMSMLPLSALIYFIMLFFYRKTGKIYLGSIFGAIITVWFLTVGTVMGATL
jgi:hypothetical protein